jgi:uncharacterized protein
MKWLNEPPVWQADRGRLRVATGRTQVGLMCCSPEREGFEVEFSSFHIGEPITEGLHA